MKILILGSLPKNEEDKLLYKEISSASRDNKISTPIDSMKIKNLDERYEAALKKVKNTDLIIGEQTKPSTGQGFEIGYAIQFNKPIIIVAKEGSNFSGIMKSCPQVKNILYYESIKDLKSKLKKEITKISKVK